jgi:integrase/recombinase XerD
MSLALVPALELAPVDVHPVDAYLATLAASSRPTQLSALHSVARAAGCQDAYAARWHEWRHPHMSALRARLIATSAPATATRILAAVRGVLRACRRAGLLSPAEEAATVDVRGSRISPGRALTGDELRRLFAACDVSAAGAQHGAALALLFGGGLRLSEVTGAQLEDLDAGTIRICGKGNKERRVALPRWTIVPLSSWLGWRGQELGPLLLPLARGQPVLRPLSSRALASTLERLARRACVRRLFSHDFRRTYATQLMDAGVDLPTIAHQMGHASVTTTERYNRSADRRGAAAAEKLFNPLEDL